MPVILSPDPELKNNLLAFGMECESGWHKLISELVEELDKLPEEIYVTQIKEKYSRLRFYIASGTEKAYNIIDRYEWLSGRVCEHCGELWAKERKSHGWYKTLCDKCVEELNWKDE